MKIVYTDVLVIGGGLAGLRVAIGAKRRGHDASSCRSCRPSARTRRPRRAACRRASATSSRARATTRTCTSRTRCAAATGAPTSASCACSSTPRPRRCASSPRGACRGAACARATARSIINGQKVTITERDEAHGLVAQRDFGGTKKWRTCYVSDGTGHAMLYAVSDRAIAESIPVHERTEAIALIHDGGRCYGAVVRDLVTGELSRLRRQGHGHRDRRRRAALSGDDQRRDLRGHRHARSRSRPASRRSATWRRCSSIRPRIFPAGILVTEGLPRRRRAAEGRRRPSLHARLRAGEEGARVARRRVARAWRSTSRKGKGAQVALRRAPLARHHAARRAAHRAQPARGQGDLPVLPRHRSGRRR